MTTTLSLLGLPLTYPGAIAAKPPAGLPVLGTRIPEFDTWRPGYAGMSVEVIEAGTTQQAVLYSDANLGTVIENPQTLLSKTDVNGQTYGKWAQPVYVTVPYVLYINSTEVTGISRPALIDLAGEDGSELLVTAARASYPVVLADVVDMQIYAARYGMISEASSGSLNTATLQAAIGAAAAQGGGVVKVPAGTLQVTPFTLPGGVVLDGEGQNATTLRCQETGNVFTLGGDGAGFSNMTLDGVNLVGGSCGIYVLNASQPYLRDVLVKRFDIGLKAQGASSALWRNFAISNCNEGADLRGDSDATGTTAGAELANIIWDGGSVSLCTRYGVQIRFVDLPAREVMLRGVGFVSNVGPAIKCHGARGVMVEGCYWTGNTADLTIEDDSNPLYASSNTSSRISIVGGQISGGRCLFNGTCAAVLLEKVDLKDVDFDLTVPTNPVLLRDCIEDSAVTTTGDTKKLIRQSSFDEGTVTGITTDATATVAWQYDMQSGEVGLFSAEVVGVARNDITYGNFWVMAGAARPGATLNFNLQTGNYTAGLVVTGSTSGASGRITAVTQAAGSGTLTLRDIVGTFVSGELIVDTSTGSARVSGSIATSSAALDGTGAGTLRADTITGTGWDATFNVSGSMIRLVVTGEAAKTIEWTGRVRRLVP